MQTQTQKSNNYEQLINIKRQLTLVEHTLTHTKKMKRKRKERESEPNCQKREKQQSSQGERIKKERENELTTPFEEKAKPRKQCAKRSAARRHRA